MENVEKNGRRRNVRHRTNRRQRRVDESLYEGPVAIGINANNLQMYDEGVIKFEDCGPAGRHRSINHAALVVGWESIISTGIRRTGW